MILRLLEHVMRKNKQTTCKVTLLTPHGKLLLFHNGTANTNNVVGSIALALLHYYCRVFLPCVVTGLFF